MLAGKCVAGSCVENGLGVAVAFLGGSVTCAKVFERLVIISSFLMHSVQGLSVSLGDSFGCFFSSRPRSQSAEQLNFVQIPCIVVAFNSFVFDSHACCNKKNCGKGVF